MDDAIPTHPMALRREYLTTAQQIVRRPTEQAMPRLILLTEALLRDLTQEPSLTVSVHMPPRKEN